MGLREIRTDGDEILRKRSKVVTVFDSKLHTLLDDMAEVLEMRNGLGIAAVQIGTLKRVIIAVDNDENSIEIINPEVIETSGEQESNEGCLSVKDIRGCVIRPKYIKIKAVDRNGNEFVVEGHDRFANVLCHEIDHLDGILFTDKTISIDDEE